jgi:hypothetical protein
MYYFNTQSFLLRSLFRDDVHTPFAGLDPIFTFFLKSNGVLLYPSLRLAVMWAAVFIIFAQGGPGKCAKVARKPQAQQLAITDGAVDGATVDDSPSAVEHPQVPVAAPVEKADPAAAAAAARSLAAENEHPTSMNGALPASLVDFFGRYEFTALFEPPAPAPSITKYTHLFGALYNVSVSCDAEYKVLHVPVHRDALRRHTLQVRLLAVV